MLPYAISRNSAEFRADWDINWDMGGRSLNRLTARFVASAGPGIYEDGGGLRLVVDEHGKRFSIRLTINGRRVHKGLGSANSLTLAEARNKASEFRSSARNGRDLAAERKIGRTGRTFRDAFEEYFRVKGPTLSNRKHAAQWRSTVETYVFPVLGQRLVADIDAKEIVSVLQPTGRQSPKLPPVCCSAWRQHSSRPFSLELENVRHQPSGLLTIWVRSCGKQGAMQQCPILKCRIWFLDYTTIERFSH